MLLSFLEKLPRAQALALSATAGVGVSYAVLLVNRYSGEDFGGRYPGEPKTTGAEWQEATKAYRKAQNQNPIKHFKG